MIYSKYIRLLIYTSVQVCVFKRC